MKQKGDYQGILELLKLQQSSYSRDAINAISTIEHFLAAQRFETSGDIVMAVSQYRYVVGATLGPFLPQAEAAEALKRLQKDKPDLFKDVDGALQQENRVLREQLNQLRGSRYPSGRNY